MDIENGDVAGIADVYLHGQSFGHVRSRDTFSGSKDPTYFWPALHYTMAAPRGKKSLAELAPQTIRLPAASKEPEREERLAQDGRQFGPIAWAQRSD